MSGNKRAMSKSYNNFRLNGGSEKGRANLSRLSIQGDYRAVAAREMDNFYSRNIAQAANFCLEIRTYRASWQKSAESIAEDRSAFSEEQFPGESSLDTEFQVLKPADWALNILQKMGAPGDLEKDRKSLRSPIGEIVVEKAHVETDDRAQSITTKVGAEGEILILRRIEIECANYRLPTECLVGEEALLRILKLECHAEDCDGLDSNQG